MKRIRKSYTILVVLSGISTDSNSSNFDILIWEAQLSELLLYTITFTELESPIPFNISCGLQNISCDIFPY